MEKDGISGAVFCFVAKRKNPAINNYRVFLSIT